MSYDPNDAKSIFLRAAELTASGERAAFLEQACAGKSELKARVESLLKTALDPDSLLDQPVAEFGATQMVPQDTSPVSLDFLEASGAAGSLGRLGGYEVLEVLGRGGMGIVLRAMDGKLNRVVAIKVLAPELASQPQWRKRFLREAQAAAAVSHDHVVTIHAVDDDEKVPLLVMECIVGQSLQQKIDKVGALGLKEILRIGMQIASGLAGVHKQGLVHRDIKPANILLENGIERVKITDFGLARATDDIGITQSGQIAGTPQYMSPEQAQGHAVDQRSDLFSLGSVLYTMCTGRPAFRADSAVAILRRVCDDTPRPINEVNAELPDWLIAIINRLMAKRPEDRIQTAEEAATLFEQWLAHTQQPDSVARPPMLAISHNSAAKTARPLVATLVMISTLSVMMFMGISFARAMSWLPDGKTNESADLLAAIYVIGSVLVLMFSIRRGESTKHQSGERSSITLQPRDGTLQRAWNDWWSERDRWFTTAVQSVLILLYLVCMICFVSFNLLRKMADDGRITFHYQLGVPSPWHRFEVYPEPNVPFRFGFHPFTWSVLLGLAGCVLYYVYWRIEKVRNLKMSRFDRPAFMLGIWGIGALFAVGLGHWQGYAALNEPRVAVTQLAPIVDANAAAIDLNGAWDGSRPWRAEFTHVQIKPGLKSVPINGKLTVADGPEGTFRIDAKFDVASRTIEGQFHGDAGGGRMRLVVSDDGNSMEGTYGWLKTVSGEEPVTAHRWDMRRRGKAVNSAQTIVQHPSDRPVLPTPDGKPFDPKELAAKIGVAAPPPAIAPFDAGQAKKHQDAWAKHLKLEVERTNMLGMKLSLIPPGKFQMGSTPEELAQLKQELEESGASDFDKFVAQSSGPRHVVELSQPFYMGLHEVTVAQFRQFVEETSYQPSAERAGNAKFTWKSFVPDAEAAKQPVCGVSWEDANTFCQWMTAKSSTDQSKLVYELPTEAQWEFACRAGSQSLWSSVDDAATLSEHAIVGQKGTPYPASVGLRRANAFGLFDLHGNVDEWCLDWHNREFYGRSPLVDPAYLDTPKDAASGRVARGGAWNADAWWARSATRAYDFPTSPTFAKGFRVVGKFSP